ncbi:hypothetical protein DSM19430T_22350 [Desulfovibrio psychrotolerans]|uniref:Uncharacterized protein n=1 Tax=Desulfovibrio psychrotolerans TaxID=415242 RepID=A0A7J0BWL2_9BACT|nr:hypothetical protein DSM19430T_22350 [Desulfovibrio psychrotolerans]
MHGPLAHDAEVQRQVGKGAVKIKNHRLHAGLHLSYPFRNNQKNFFARRNAVEMAVRLPVLEDRVWQPVWVYRVRQARNAGPSA